VRLLVVHRHYWPDATPYAFMLRKLSEEYVCADHDITVLASQPSFRPELKIPKQASMEIKNGVVIRRLWTVQNTGRSMFVKILAFLLYCAQVFLYVAKNGANYDVVLSTTTPPVVGAWVLRQACRFRRLPHIYHVLDIAPEILLNRSVFSRNSWIYRTLLRMDTENCRAACQVVTLSTDMKRTLVNRGIDESGVCVINSFKLDEEFDLESRRNSSDAPELAESKFNIVFTGNLGNFQALDVILEAISKTENPKLAFTFVGEGDFKSTLIERSKQIHNVTVRIVPHQPVAAVRKILDQADMGLVTLAPGISSYAYPSKVMGYLSAGCPVLAVTDPDSELATMVEDKKVGRFVSINSVDGLSAAFDRLPADMIDSNSMRSAARKLYDEAFSFEIALLSWKGVLDRMEEKISASIGSHQ